MLDIKKLLIKILEWIKTPVVQKSGADGSITGYKAVRTDKNTIVYLGVGNGGTNHGVYSGSGSWILYQTEDKDIGIGQPSSGSIYFKGTNFNDLFVRTEHTLTTTFSITNGNNSNTSYTVSKSGYIPVGIVGWRVVNGDNGSGSSFALPFGITLTSASSGSGTIGALFRAVGTVSNCTFRVTVLWIKDI